MSSINNECRGYYITLKACYRFVNSDAYQSKPEIFDSEICDKPFNQYLKCLKSAMNERGIDVEELRQYHSKIKSKNDPAKK